MQTAAQLVVKCLEENDVEFVFGIPGAKIDTVFDALHDSKIKLILCRHEQNATFMAAAYGRTTGKPGVVLVTSGPGVANLTTGLLTATTEGDPIVALGGNVALSMKFRETHQNVDNARLLEPVTKSSIEVTSADIIPEAMANAFRVSTDPKAGACFISLPQDILKQETDIIPCKQLESINFGRASDDTISRAVGLLESAKSPILFLGQESSRVENAKLIEKFVRKFKIPVMSTYQAAGVIPQDLLDCFYGRVGLFKNQPGDKVLAQADIVITIGLNLFEYDAEVWNSDATKKILHIDYKPANIHYHYQPECEMLGNIDENISLLTDRLTKLNAVSHPEWRNQLFEIIKKGENKQGKDNRIHPLRFVYELNKVIDDDTIVCCDVGSVYMWLARYLISHKPHQLLFSNGQQTLGIALPWAMAVKLASPNKKIISISGDGGFLFSATELETAVRENIKITHFVWQDGSYDMVKEQELMKYKRGSGVNLGDVNIPEFASAFGADGYDTNNPEDIVKLYNKSLASDKPTLINVSMDYSDNMELFLQVQQTGVGH